MPNSQVSCTLNLYRKYPQHTVDVTVMPVHVASMPVVACIAKVV